MNVKIHASLPAEMLEYLDNHPDIFAHHPELLTKLDIPHITGKNVASLIERQVHVLRRELDDLRNSITRLEFDADHYHKLAADMHALALELLQAQAPQDLYQILRRDLKTYYSADEVLLLIFSNTKIVASHSGLRTCRSNTSLRFMFAELFYRGQPLCDSLQEEHLQALFGSNSEKISSTVLLPGAGDGWQELLVLGSHTESRYSHGPELELLRFTNDIICRQIPAWP